MNKFGVVLVAIGALILLAAIGFLPYIFYIGIKYGWLDDRIVMAPMGMPVTILALLLIRLGFSAIEVKGRHQ